MVLTSKALLIFGHFDFPPFARLNVLPKLKFDSIFMKTDTVNNETTLFLIMQMKFRSFNFYLLCQICLDPKRTDMLEMCL